MATMGFTATQSVQEVRKIHNPEDLLLQFDSGAGISFQEATHNTIVLGSSGVGKTSSVMLPALHALLRSGRSGLVVDIKGNFTEQTKKLAAHCDREADIVEIGNSSDALPINFIAGMTDNQIFEFLRVLALTPFEGQSGSIDWHVHGVRQAVDCLNLLRFYQSSHPIITANLNSLEEMLMNVELAHEMFQYFGSTLAREDNTQHQKLIKRAQGDEFHILRTNVKSDDYGSQMTWRLGAIRNALSLLRDTGMMEGFAAPGAQGIDLAHLIYDEKKVVVLRFGAASSDVGALIARYMLQSFHRAVYQCGLLSGQQVFFVGDEAQDFISLAPYSKNNDNAFTAKAREFKVIQLLGTQSVASLYSRGAGMMQVNQFLNNFGNKLIFYNDDPLTQELAVRFDPHVSFQEFELGQCLAIHFDMNKRRPTCSRYSLQQAHDTVKSLLPDTFEQPRPVPQEDTPCSILEDAFERVKQQDREVMMKKISEKCRF